MNNKDEPSSQIERLHQLAALSQDDLEAAYSKELAEWLIKIVNSELAGHEPPSVNSPKEFADVLHVLGSNKRAWSQRLGAILVELIESQTIEQTKESTERLNQFILSCPWKFLCESARQKL